MCLNNSLRYTDPDGRFPGEEILKKVFEPVVVPGVKYGGPAAAGGTLAAGGAAATTTVGPALLGGFIGLGIGVLVLVLLDGPDGTAAPKDGEGCGSYCKEGDPEPDPSTGVPEEIDPEKTAPLWPKGTPKEVPIVPDPEPPGEGNAADPGETKNKSESTSKKKEKNKSQSKSESKKKVEERNTGYAPESGNCGIECAFLLR
jgi:hypothetical protein